MLSGPPPGEVEGLQAGDAEGKIEFPDLDLGWLAAVVLEWFPALVAGGATLDHYLLHISTD